jgi:diguanylate cyclase (GGDEF)-like protein
MNSVEALLAALLLLHVFFAALWFSGAWLRLARGPALHWGAMTLVCGVGMGLLAMRPDLDPWVGRWVSNACNVLGLIVAARGLAAFTRTPLRDREHAAVALLGLGGAALALATKIDDSWITVCASGAMAWIVLRGTVIAGRALQREFGRIGAWVTAVPMLLVGVLTASRALGALVGSSVGRPLDQNDGSQVNLLLGILVLTMVVNAGFFGMVLLRLIRRLQHLSMHDTLTGLPNRRSLRAVLEGYALLSIDVDHFKHVNDHHGHAGGDAALAHIAAVLRRVARASDSPARVGGEEFALLLPSTGQAGALRAAERLLAAVREAPLAYEGAPVALTVSIGVSIVEASHGRAAEELSALWKRVDAALYAAKAQGRDRLVFGEA